MKNNKGYYSWIHSMKNAAMESHFIGQQKLNEAKEASQGKKRQLNEAREDKNWEGPNLPREEFYKLAKQIADLLKQDGGITPESIQKAGGDPEEYKKVRELKVKDTNMDGTANASDVVAANKLDAADGVPNTKIGPNFTNPLGAQARLEMGYGVEGDEELARGEEPLHVRKAREAEMERRAEDEDYGRRAGMPDEDKPFRMMESLNQKISRILREEEEPVRKQSDKPTSRRGQSPGKSEKIRGYEINAESGVPGTEKTVGEGGVNFEALVDIYKNPHKYPENIAKAVRDSFEDIFSKGEGLEDADFYYGKD